MKPDLIQYHVSCTTYYTSIISCSSALYDTCIRRQPDMLESSLYNDGLMNVFGSVLVSALCCDERINECVWVSAVHLTYVGGRLLRTSDQI